MMNNQKGFTLIEIIAVLVILGILAAVAIPKYLDLAASGRQQAAQGAIAEVKGRLSQVQGKYILEKGSAPNSTALYDYAIEANQFKDAANLANLGTDFTVTVTKATPISISVTQVQGKDVSVTNTFSAAGD
jgi:prepilin-type N-terminal cleavage/methylation domain-containing protein